MTAAPVAADDQPDSSAPEPKVDTRKPAEPAGEPPARREAEDREAERRRDAAELLEYQRKEAARSRTTRGPRKSQKQGDLRKCPTCWRQVGGGDTGWSAHLRSRYHLFWFYRERGHDKARAQELAEEDAAEQEGDHKRRKELGLPEPPVAPVKRERSESAERPSAGSKKEKGRKKKKDKSPLKTEAPDYGDPRDRRRRRDPSDRSDESPQPRDRRARTLKSITGLFEIACREIRKA